MAEPTGPVSEPSQSTATDLAYLDTLLELARAEAKTPAPPPRPAIVSLAIVSTVALSLFVLADLGALIALELATDGAPRVLWIVELIGVAVLAAVTLATVLRVVVLREAGQPAEPQESAESVPDQ